MATWLEDLLSMTDAAETPKNYIRWAGLASISAVVRNNVFLDKYLYKLYPNIYVMLIGESGLKKSFATNIAKDLVRSVGNIKVISGRNSIQAILQDLGKVKTNENGKPMDMDSTAFISSNEMTNLLVDDPQALSILTELYDRHYNKDWKNTLKGSGIDSLKNIYLTMLSGSNQVHFKDKVGQKDVEGGFIARTLLIVESERNRLNSLTSPPEEEFNLSALLPRLKEISNLHGEFSYAYGVAAYFDKWYTSFFSKKHHDRTGTINRCQDHILKLAMLLSLSEDDSLTIRKRHIEEAIETIMNLLRGVERVTDGTGTSDLSAKQYKFMQTLVNEQGYTVEHATMLRRNWGDFDIYDMEKIVATLSGAGIIEIVTSGKERMYRLSDLAVAKYMEARN